MQADYSQQETRWTWLYALGIALVAVGYRLYGPYVLGPSAVFMWNAKPVGALALFVGSRLSARRSWLLPLAVMLVSDLLLMPAYAPYPSMSWSVTPVVYASFVGYSLLGMLLPRKSWSPRGIAGLAVAGSVQFFLITNFAVWVSSAIRGGANSYAPTLGGLIDCYVRALPFAGGTFIGDLVYSGLIFAGQAALFMAIRPSPVAREAV